jgi:hypothetical protein
LEDIRDKSALAARIQSNDGFNPESAAKKRKLNATVDSADKSFAGAFE